MCGNSCSSSSKAGSQQQPNSSKAGMVLRVGLVGGGLSATTFHAPFLKASTAFNITAVLRASSTKPVPGLEEVPVFTDLAAFLGAEPPVDLVVITTPTHTHYSLAKACLSADRHVVLEKPMAATYSEARELCSLARSRDRMLAVYHNRRWDGDFQTAAALIQCGVLGRLVEFESHFDRYRPALKPGWKEDDGLPGAGVLFDLGSHLIDQALCLFGPPTRVTGLVSNQRHLPSCNIHDAFTITLQYDRPEGPLVVLLRSSSLCSIPGPCFALHGTQGSFVKHGLDVQEQQLRGGMSPLQPGFGAEAPQGYGVLQSQALDLRPALQPLAPAGPMEALPEVPETVPDTASPAAAAAQVAADPAAAGPSSSMATTTQPPAATVGPTATTAATKATTDGPSAATAASAGNASTAMPPPPSRVGRVGPAKAGDAEPAATVASIAAAVLAKIDAGGAGGAAGDAAVRVVTLQGCWHKFYDEVAAVLLSHQQLAPQATGGVPSGGDTGLAGGNAGPAGVIEGPQRVLGAEGGAGVATEAAGGLTGGQPGLTGAAGRGLLWGSGAGSGSTTPGSIGGSSGSIGGRGRDVNSLLSVPPEAAAEVIRVIEMAMKSSKEGCVQVYAAAE